MPLSQMQDFTFKHSEQQDAIYTEYTAQQIKALFDSRGDELRTALNLLITALSSTNGASNIGTNTIQDLDGATIQDMLISIRDKLRTKADVGSVHASTVNADPIAIGSGTNVQAQLAWLLSQIAIAATGSTPDGTLTEAKLAQALVDKINKALSNTGVLTTLLTTDKSSLVNALNEHLAGDASLTVKGHVQLQTTVDSSETKALTPKALNDHFAQITTTPDANKIVKRDGIGNIQANILVSKNAQANYGGAVLLEKPSSGSTLNGNISAQVSLDRLQFAETAGTARGAYIDFTKQADFANSEIWTSGNSGPFYKGTGSPEGVVTAPVGALYQRSDGGASTTLYVKQSGTGNTGWVAK